MAMYRATSKGMVPFTPAEEAEELARIAAEKAKPLEKVLSLEGLAALIINKLALTPTERDQIYVPVPRQNPQQG